MTAKLPATPALTRLAYAAALAALLTATVFEVAEHGHLGAALAGVLAPDLALLLGGGAGLAKGQLHPRAVPVYNAVHRAWGPALLIVGASTGLLGTAALVAGLAWGVHVALDRTVGYGLRTPEGFQRAA
jgi:hypothetical protein